MGVFPDSDRGSYEHLFRCDFRKVRSIDTNDVRQTDRCVQLHVGPFVRIEEIIEQGFVEAGEEVPFLVVLW